MSELILSRRGLIAGAAALFVAPAIIRPGLLMPIKVVLPAPVLIESHPLLTINMITREANRLLQNLLTADPTPERFLAVRDLGLGECQKSVDFLYSTLDRSLPLDEFSRRILEPAMRNLACEASIHGLRMSRTELELPQGIHEATNEFVNGVPLRGISAYDIASDQIITRLDVRLK